MPSTFQRASDFLRWNFSYPGSERVRAKLEKYYKHYYDYRDNIEYVWSHYDRRGQALRAAGERGARVLDVGCGIGTNILWACLCGAHGVGVEIKTSDVEVARTRQQALEGLVDGSLDCTFVASNLFDFRDEEGFDLVFLQEAFHHLEPREAVVERLSSLVKPGGRLVLQESNAWNLLLQAKLFKHRGFKTVIYKQGKNPTDSYLYGNERIVTAGKLDRLFAPFGFTGRCHYFRVLPTRLATNSTLASMAETIETSMGQSLALRPFCMFYEWVGSKNY